MRDDAVFGRGSGVQDISLFFCEDRVVQLGVGTADEWKGVREAVAQGFHGSSSGAMTSSCDQSAEAMACATEGRSELRGYLQSFDSFHCKLHGTVIRKGLKIIVARLVATTRHSGKGGMLLGGENNKRVTARLSTATSLAAHLCKPSDTRSK